MCISNPGLPFHVIRGFTVMWGIRSWTVHVLPDQGVHVIVEMEVLIVSVRAASCIYDIVAC